MSGERFIGANQPTQIGLPKEVASELKNSVDIPGLMRFITAVANAQKEAERTTAAINLENDLQMSGFEQVDIRIEGTHITLQNPNGTYSIRQKLPKMDAGAAARVSDALYHFQNNYNNRD